VTPLPGRYAPFVGVDWVAWHADYDSDTPLRRRLEIVQRHIRARLDESDGSPIRVIGICAGQGRDLLGAVDGHRAAAGVKGRLVELDPRLAAEARRRCAQLGLGDTEIVVGDAGTTRAYEGATPADLVLACGVFGNISDRDIERTVRALPMLCAPDATVIWTRHRRPPDITPVIRGWFRDAGFEEIAFEPVPDSPGSVGVARLTSTPAPFRRRRLFRFHRPRRRASGSGLRHRRSSATRIYPACFTLGPVTRRSLGLVQKMSASARVPASPVVAAGDGPGE